MSQPTQLIENISASYDHVPYASNPFHQTHPDYLRAVSTLFDVPTVAVSNANILEIGCSFGGNILPLAQQYPDANIIGLDLSAEQIRLGQQAVVAMGLNNIQLQQQDINNYTPPAQHFDYIICHGVYSWVPEFVREAILRVISEGLAPNGVAIVSYNTYPGWKIKEVYRDMMQFRSQDIPDVLDKIRYGRGMLNFLKEHLPTNSPWQLAIEQNHDHIDKAVPSYLAHEYFELVNDPCYFHEFMESAQQCSLGFVAEAEFGSMLSPSIPDAAKKALLAECGNDVVKLEQFYDFLTNRTFRQSILTRSDSSQEARHPQLGIRNEALLNLHIQGQFTLEASPTDSTKKVQAESDNVWRSLKNSHAKFKDNTLSQWFFKRINAANGKSLAISELWDAAQLELPKTIKQTDFMQLVFDIIVYGAVNIRSQALTWSDVDITKPCISTSNRALFALTQKYPKTLGLTTAWHNAFQGNLADAELLPLLDGARNRDDLAKVLIDAVSARRILFHDAKQKPITTAKKISGAAYEHVDKLIYALQYNGMLC